MRKKLFSFITAIFLLLALFSSVESTYSATTSSNSFTILTEAEKGTFNEYRYKITRDFFKLRETFEVEGKINGGVANRILLNAQAGYKYLPDDLKNENNYNILVTALKRGIKSPNVEAYYTAIKKGLTAYVENASIESVTGTIQATPVAGNAPLVVTLRAKVQDPSGTKLGTNAYTWWIDVNGQKKILGTKPSISYTFLQEGIFSVFLDVKSSHRNQNGFVDVLPYTGEVKIEVKEKIASVILRIGGKKLPTNDEIKFSPEEASYGLIFDATSSVPSTGTRFLRTSWEFGNGVTKSYRGSPRIERVIYAREGNYDAKFILETNRGDIIERGFKVMVHKPIASISTSQESGFMGDKFTFRAVKHGTKKNLAYSWEIIDLSKDDIVLKKSGDLFTYSFNDKGRYSIRLKITDAAGNFDIDTKDIYINSRAPVASFSTKVPLPNKPNEVFLDATSSFDPDYGDEGKLKYSWTIDGNEVNLERPNDNGSLGYYTFDSIGEHSVILTVEDPDDITATTKRSVAIKSTLWVDFDTFPRVIQREGFIKFIANSPDAKFYEWDFGDGSTKGESDDTINHSYEKSGVFTVKLKVRGKENNFNTVSKTVYVGDSKNPVSVITLSKSQGFDFVKEEGACEGEQAYIVSREDNITVSSSESINTNGLNAGLEYSWKLGKDKYSSGPTLNVKLDEIGCTSVKLTVKSSKDKTTDSETVWLKAKNVKPSLTGLRISPVDINSDPVIVNLSALGAKDRDGVIQSYLWYYTTDADNEAQDFRVTKDTTTTFVLPKIPGNYYFGVVMKDNNDAKVASEDIIGKNSITLAGDNVNTPLIDFTTNDSSVGIGDSVVFTAKAENVLGKSIEKASKFSWDFDGDGFYERETDEGEVSYKYKSSGTFYPKVKVKHKGFSNTRTLTINVANKLVSDFTYISIGNKYVFLDKSRGTVDHLAWDLGDGTKKQNETHFVHNYDDNKSVHSVELSVAEGTKIKKSTQEVSKDIKNIMKARKKGLNVFSYPLTNSDGIISLEEEESIFMYLGESNGEFEYYGIDYDIDSDSDLNGGKDDDIDNIHNKSYKNGDPDLIELNPRRNQTIRLFLLDAEGNTIDNKDITIEKTYIKEQEEIDPDSITFEGISDDIKVKIEELKSMISNLDQQDRLKGMLFIQKMQENWDDDTEKTRTIIEFEEFLDTTGAENSDKIIELLESLLLGIGESGEKTVAFNALKALIPDTIECKTEGESCKEMLTKKLEQIKISSDIEGNRVIGTEILEVIAQDSSMSDKQKQDFKAVLKVLVYSGVENIPENEVEEIAKGDVENPAESEEESGKLMNFLKSLGYWAAWLVGIIVVLMLIFWIFDFIKNRKSGESFEDFVSDKTSGDDILGGSTVESVDPLLEEEKSNEQVEEESSAVFSDDIVDNVELGVDVEDNPIKSDESDVVVEETIPDWLSGNIDEGDNSVDEIEKNEIQEKTTPEKDPLSQQEVEEENVGISLSHPEDIVENEKKEDDFDFDLDEDTQIKDETPEWLQESLTDKLPNKKELDKEKFLEEQEKNTPEQGEVKEKEPVIVEDSEESFDFENDVPDWLQDGKEDKELKKEIKEMPKKDKQETKIEVVENSSEVDTIKKVDSSVENKTEDNIPDWLKGSLDETSDKKEGDIEKKEDKLEDITRPVEDVVEGNDVAKAKTKNTKLDNADVPDWLKESISENTVDSSKEEIVEEKKEVSAQKKKPAEKAKTSPKKKSVNKTEDTLTSKDEVTNKGAQKKDELWDDGMTVPDWLKTDDKK